MLKERARHNCELLKRAFAENLVVGFYALKI